MEEEVYEIKGKGNTWRIYYPDECGIQTQLPVYDKEGNLKTILWVGESTGKLTESSQVFSSAKEALAYAKKIGAEKVKLIKLQERKKKNNSK